jgi:streptogramin lyase
MKTLRARHSRRARLVAVIVVLAMIAAGAAGVYAATKTGDNLHLAGSLAAVETPGAPATGFGSVWVASATTGELVRLDPRSGKTVAKLAVTLPNATGAYTNGAYSAVETGNGSVWVASHDNGQVIRVDPATDKIAATIEVPSFPEVFSVTEGAVWARSANTIVHIDPSSNRIVGSVFTHSPASGIAAGPDAVWAIAGQFNWDLLKIDPATNRVVEKIPLGRLAPKGAPTLAAPFAQGILLEHDGLLWIKDQGGVVAIDPVKRQKVVDTRLPGFELTMGFAAGKDRIWVATFGRLAVLDAGDGHVIARLPLPKGTSRAVEHVTVGEGAAWVAIDGFPRLYKVAPAS